MLQEVDDMTTGVLERPSSSPTQYASVLRKVQTIIRWCIVYIGASIYSTTIALSSPESVSEGGALGVKRGARRLPGNGACGGCAPVPPYLGGRGPVYPGHEDREMEDLEDGDIEIRDASTFSLGLTPLAQSHPSGADTSYIPRLSIGGISYAPPPPGTVRYSFDAPAPPGTVGSSVLHMPISRTSSSNSYSKLMS
ncbi:hypothetical protein M9H77_29984 [Catharanthus roseus]|uniref:Uncharacterized protein n=1 Tax=Catharanthus roseus TaxID=4058 RepID=A0ACB9ZVX3_CATRO|nr:hypothetical protein M9H77_29984 [Catharanthus roseus]